MEDFVNSKSMLTPGVAGALALMITGTLASQFELPGNWTGLITSFILGTSVWADKKLTPGFMKVLFYIINSLIIFSVAMGLNTAGMAAQGNLQPVSRVERGLDDSEQRKPFFHHWF